MLDPLRKAAWRCCQDCLGGLPQPSTLRRVFLPQWEEPDSIVTHPIREVAGGGARMVESMCWLLLPVSWSQALQGLQQAAGVSEAFQELLIGRYLKGRTAASIGPPLTRRC